MSTGEPTPRASSSEASGAVAETSTGGRPRIDLQERLQRILGFWPDFTNWPRQQDPCWPGPRLIWFDGKMQPTPRACLILILGQPFHPTWRIQGCDKPGCINPHHARLIVVNRSDGTPVEPLPLAAHAQFVADAMNTERQALVSQCADWLLTPPLGREIALSLSDATLKRKAKGAYSPSIIASALEEIQSLD